MRKLTKTHTGVIVTDTDLGLEYLYVGDYGKENNIKADFLGYTKRIDKVENTPVDLKKKLVVTVSSQHGCPMHCNFCDCPKVGFNGNATVPELLAEINTGIALSGVTSGERLNVHYARMGEPTFNMGVIDSAAIVAIENEGGRGMSFQTYHPVVSTMMPKSNQNLVQFLESWIKTGYQYGGKDGFGLQFSINTLDEVDRNKMFHNMSHSLREISDIVNNLPAPLNRKFTLNFAVTPESNLDPMLMDKYFDKERCIVKITPIHATKAAVANNYEIARDFDVYEQFEKPLTADGWQVIVFIPSAEEDADRITCGNALIAANARNSEFL